ncbi:hypothetical protein HMPREF9336_04229 [Segniliparus rugosus ATCC BAA-974]|uniref:Uncharacterized protein n=1 Tax=Segniliparus rugosus (strain ATCC BAA-974 / DSM 45345 / CCUG 50838 / CIP 108380 / JCM 13579 / CDC 945) TaxID=679197 RepID=U1N957_SEGRC|nr:hypothetical protein HMPREF9336_04229 [Segniliparus rugosus ATCC BAA-974]
MPKTLDRTSFFPRHEDTPGRAIAAKISAEPQTLSHATETGSTHRNSIVPKAAPKYIEQLLAPIRSGANHPHRPSCPCLMSALPATNHAEIGAARLLDPGCTPPPERLISHSPFEPHMRQYQTSFPIPAKNLGPRFRPHAPLARPVSNRRRASASADEAVSQTRRTPALISGTCAPLNGRYRQGRDRCLRTADRAGLVQHREAQPPPRNRQKFKGLKNNQHASISQGCRKKRPACNRSGQLESNQHSPIIKSGGTPPTCPVCTSTKHYSKSTFFTLSQSPIIELQWTPIHASEADKSRRSENQVALATTSPEPALR